MGGANFIFGAAIGAAFAASIYSDTARSAIKTALGAVGNEIRKQLPFETEDKANKEHSHD